MLCLLTTVAAAAALPEEQPLPDRPVACLSVSPLRALPATLHDSAAALHWRDRLVSELRPSMGPAWAVEPAGRCPEGLPVLDLFQQADDFLRDPETPGARLHLEWRHVPGESILFLDEVRDPRTQIPAWAHQIRSVVSLHVAHLVLASGTPGTRIEQIDATPLEPLATRLPSHWAQVPGPFTLTLSAPDCQPLRLDTSIAPGQILELEVALKPLPSTPRPPHSPSSPRARWRPYAWGATGTVALTAGLAAWWQERADTRYSSLGDEASDAQFSSAWSELRTANLTRNSLALLALGLLGGSLYLQF